MKVSFGLVGIISGSGGLGGITIQNGRYGHFARMNPKGISRNDNIPLQPCQKEVFINVSKLWRTLTIAQVNTWNAAAIFPATGYAYYLKINLAYYKINASILIAPPTIIAPASIVLTSAFFILAAGKFRLNYTGTPSANLTIMRLFTITNKSAGARVPVHSQFRLITSTNLIAGAQTFDFSPWWYSSNIVLGSSNFIGVRLMDTVTGSLTPLQFIQFNA